MISIYNRFNGKYYKTKYLEKQLQLEVEELLHIMLKRNANRYFFYHPCEKEGSKNKGLPDIIGWFDYEFETHIFFIELKLGNNKATEIQLDMMERLKASGLIGSICHSVIDVIDFFKEYYGFDFINYEV